MSRTGNSQDEVNDSSQGARSPWLRVIADPLEQRAGTGKADNSRIGLGDCYSAQEDTCVRGQNNGSPETVTHRISKKPPMASLKMMKGVSMHFKSEDRGTACRIPILQYPLSETSPCSEVPKTTFCYLSPFNWTMSRIYIFT